MPKTFWDAETARQHVAGLMRSEPPAPEPGPSSAEREHVAKLMRTRTPARAPAAWTDERAEVARQMGTAPPPPKRPMTPEQWRVHEQLHPDE